MALPAAVLPARPAAPARGAAAAAPPNAPPDALPNGGAPPAWTVLRVAAALCFVGHGAFGIVGKEDWLPFFAVAGIGPDAAHRLMPVVGTIDVAAGFAALVCPTPALFLYMTLWALWTAALRPLAGLPAWEMVERAGNYGVPFALLLWSGAPAAGPRAWLARARPRTFGASAPGAVPLGAGAAPAPVARALAWTTALLLAGHGALALAGKPLLVRHAALLGLGPRAVAAQGAGEIALAIACALRPSRGLLLAVFAWKVATELLFLAAGAPVWEVVERGGSYGAPLALAVLLGGMRWNVTGRVRWSALR